MNIELLQEDFCHYARYIRNVSDATIKRYREQITYFTRALNITNTQEITHALVLRYFLDGRVKRGWKTETYRTYYMTLRVFFRWCVKQGYMTENATDEIELPKKEKSLPKKLKTKEALLLLEVAYNYPYTQKALKYRNHAIFATFLFAGLRKSELLNLKYGDVDIENRTLFIRRGKGNKDRIIPMSHTLAQSLNRYVIERKKQKRTCPEFFACSNRDRGFNKSGLKHLKNLLQDATGLKFSIHQLRHTFATLMIEGGCDIFSLSKMMGHSDIKTTTIYLSATAEHLRCQMTKHPLNRSIEV